MRFQALMPDILHTGWGSKDDRMRKASGIIRTLLTSTVSMSDMKYDAIVGQGIPIIDRIPIPKEAPPGGLDGGDGGQGGGRLLHGRGASDGRAV